MIGFIIFIISFIILASLLYLANTVFVGVLTIFYGNEAQKIANKITSTLSWILGIGIALFIIWNLFALFGPLTAFIMLIVAFAVWLFVKSF